MQENARSAGATRAWASAAIIGALLAFATDATAGADNCRAKRNRQVCDAPAPPANSAPTISGTPPSAVETGQAYSFTPAASDPNGDILTFSIVNRPPWAAFNASTGRLSGTPTSTSVGEYVEISISVSDGQTKAALAPFSIVVSQANRPPSISGSPLATAREGQLYEFVPAAADADGDALTFSIANKPAWASFNASTGALRGTPGTGSVGTYSGISIRVSDGLASVALPSFSVSVQQVSLGSATLSWIPPTMRVDGSPLLSLSGYRIRYGTSVGSYPNVVTIPNGGVTSAVVGNLPPATYYFVISAYDSAGIESDNTPAVSKTII